MNILPDFAYLQERLQQCSENDVSFALECVKPGLDQLFALLSPAADRFLPQLAARSRHLTLQRFGKTTQMYAPLYLSNFCTNKCVYCGFSANNRIERRSLTLDEAEKEAEILKNRGFGHILLVSGEADAIIGVSYLKNLCDRLRSKFASLSLEVQPLSEAEYRQLFTAGITGVAVYQETYDRELYQAIHPAGKKRDYNFRLDTPRRCSAAGMREVGIGALLGLSDWRAEGMALGFHLHHLRKTFWKTNFTVSFPRLRPAAGSFAPLTEVSLKNLSQLIFALRIFDPDVGLIISTREEAAYRDGMLGLGPTRYSAGSCTAPGGYGNPELDGEQFSVGDHRSLPEMAAVIRSKGFDPVCKDWDAVFQETTLS
jgi:2-iminoacetate synthase